MRTSLVPLFRSAVSATLCGLLIAGTLPLSAAAPKPVATAPVDKASLIVERFTFGPTPGEVAQVRSIGAEAWFERQLNPASIDDAALEQRLDAYPSMRLPQDERIARYPTPATIRQYARTGYLPNDPETRAIVQDQVEFYQMRQDEKQTKSTASTGTAPAPIVRETPPAPQDPKAAQRNVNKGFAALENAGNAPTSGDGMTMSGTRSEMAVGASTAAAAAAAQVNPAPQNLDQSTQALPQAQVDAFLALTPDQRYQRLLRMQPVELIALRKGMHGQDAKLGDGMSPLQKETLASLAGTNRMISGELFSSRLIRDIYSERQLEAVMTDFWLNHFNVYIRKDGQMPSLLPDYEATVRTHALGRFEDLLEATAKSPAMLLYLDNAQSTGPDSQAAGKPKGPNAKKSNVGLNENYARELMELHTLGVNGGYTQKDVTEVAKVFTGWTMDRPGEGGNFVYNDRRHEPGSKQVLGTTIKESGESEGEQVLHMLSTSPATAHFISLELAERFVSDTPPLAMVDRMAQTFLKSNGDMKQVLRAMVHSPEFYSAATVNAKLKTPLEYVVSAARATGADVQNPLPLAQSLERLGMPLYGCQPPTGYKWDSETWLSSSALVNRMNFSLVLSANKLQGTTIDTTRLLNGSDVPTAKMVPADATNDPIQAKERLLESVLLTAPASQQTRTAVLSQTDDSAVQQAMRDFANAGPAAGGGGGKKLVQPLNNRALGATPVKMSAPPADKQAAVMVGLLVGSPEFQRR